MVVRKLEQYMKVWTYKFNTNVWTIIIIHVLAHYCPKQKVVSALPDFLIYVNVCAIINNLHVEQTPNNQSSNQKLLLYQRLLFVFFFYFT